MPSAVSTASPLQDAPRRSSGPIRVRAVVQQPFDPISHCSEQCRRRWRDDAECLCGRASDVLTLECDGRGRLGPLTFSKRVTEALLKRSGSAFADDLSATLETMLEMYLDVVEAHGQEAAFSAREARMVYWALEDMEREAGHSRDVGTLEEDVRIHFDRVHGPFEGEPYTPPEEWPTWHHALLRKIGRMTAAGQAAVLDRVLRAIRMSRRHSRFVDEALVAVGLTSAEQHLKASGE
jgi:hypothetical protein